MSRVSPSLDERMNARAAAILERTSNRRGLGRVLPFLGPAFVASVAYMDPGNFATNIQGGAQFGYLLLWVVLSASLMAMLIQTLSSKLGIVTGKNLAEHIRDRWPRPVVWFYWVQAELVAMATDLAEFLGASLAFALLFNLPLLWGAVITGVITFTILALQNRGFRPIEIAITAFVAVIALAYVVQVILSRPGLDALGGFVPRFEGPESLYLAVGIIGATVMPHVIYLHSALTQHRIPAGTEEQKRRLVRYNQLDVLLAMSIAALINLSMLASAAAAFHFGGQADVADLTVAYRTLTPLLGGAAAVAFALALLSSGLSSSAVGTMAGQVVMQGFVGFRIPLLVRRLITMLPAFAVILAGLNPTDTLVLSQVVLSFGIPFALVPLLIFTARRDVMGGLVNTRLVTVTGWVIAALIISLNVYLLAQTFLG
ncbi:manganese transport protein mntH [Deinococcus aerius]|uniref:Divalent metal cation transporter MntH n=3 Tax=Deinococcus TaxID=1298 RepID=A0A2I9DIS6_9DEIO|nr:manganese transport protein [Deinococcus metallilatus]GBF04661.1 manganese transport protein mntH [Deinococcus aerius]GMA17810.1 divalent metal cation transporter MntH [Deinococcus metallilatus]